MSSLHIQAQKEEIAQYVLMPGDPLRAKVMSERFLESPKLVNTIRNMLAYTGTFQGKKITIMGSGMGVPSIGIYTHELFDYYEVEKIIRVGTCGGIQSHLSLGDIVMAQSVSTDSNYINQFQLPGTFAPTASWELLKNASQYCEHHQLKYSAGNVLCTDIFYNAQSNSWQDWAKMGVLAIEMESTALYANAAYFGKSALTILTVSDQLLAGERSPAADREQAFTQMFAIGLNTLLTAVQ